MKKNKKSRKWIWIGLAIVLVIFLASQLLSGRSNLADRTKTFTISQGEISLVSLSTGKISSSDQANIRLSGSVTEVFVKLGDSVKKGDLLAEYTKTSSTNNIISPITGIVTQLPTQLGTSLAISNSAQFKMQIGVTESEINKIKLSQSAEVYVSAIDYTFYGSVTSISKVGTTIGLNTSYPVVITFDGQGQNLLVGMSAVSKTFVEGYGDYYVHGKVEAANETKVELDGTITQLNVKIGDTVSKGQKLGEYQSSMQTNTKVYASRDGIITAIASSVSPEFIISNPAELRVIINITETDIHKIKVGQSADVYVEAVDRNFVGTVSNIGLVGNTNLDYTTYPVTIEFDGEDAPLFIGMSSSAKIITETKSNILIVPFEAIVTENTQRYLVSAEWLQDTGADQSEYFIPIETGIADAFNVEVIGENLLGKEIIIIEESSVFPIFSNND
jgi:multidrug efflux pump subunit AcrA (membrane-fusion protein)